MPTKSPGPLLTRLLAPFAAGLWIAFCVWTAIALPLWAWNAEDALGLDILPHQAGAPCFVDGAERRSAIADPALRAALRLLVREADVIWLFLAVLNAYRMTALRVGLATARQWAGQTLILATAFVVVNSLCGNPFGQLWMGKTIGMKLGGLAIGWILLWVMLVLASRETVLWRWPRASFRAVTIGASALAFLTFANIERAVRGSPHYNPMSRGWWWWTDPATRISVDPPVLFWFGIALLSIVALLLMREHRVVDATGAAARQAWRAAVLLIAFNAAAFFTHAIVALR